jgi:hypothetical protein
MKRLIYQVYVGNRTKLYDFCTSSVKKYAERIGADYICQTKPILRIIPDPFNTGRVDKCGGWKKHGYMPIFEKENVFNYFKDYDQCCVIDADIYIHDSAPSIFEELKGTVASVYEAELPLTEQYKQKIIGYSRMMMKPLNDVQWEWTENGGMFFNSGVMLYDAKKMLEVLKGRTPKQVLDLWYLKDLVDGKGPFKWQSDQITLNYFFKKNKVNVQKLDWKWNSLYTAIPKDREKETYFLHFFLKDHLPEKGENVEKLIEEINKIYV